MSKAWKKIKMVVIVVVVAVLAVYTGGLALAAMGYASLAAAIAARSLAHSLTRAAISKAQCGRYSEGFWSGFASSALGGTIGRAKSLEGQMARAAIVGGTASKLGGTASRNKGNRLNGVKLSI